MAQVAMISTFAPISENLKTTASDAHSGLIQSAVEKLIVLLREMRLQSKWQMNVVGC
jgi:hypothetical protein